jgi:hypothetical protein
MDKISKLPVGFKIIIGFHLFNIILWTIGQGGAVISYDTVAKWGLQDSREMIDPVIVEVNRGIGLTDIIIMIPLFIIAVVGLWRFKFYGAVASWLALGITLYWPVVFWSSQYLYGQSGIKYQPTLLSTSVFLSMLLIISLWAVWYLLKNYKLLK